MLLGGAEMSKKEQIIRSVALVILELFAVMTIIGMIISRQYHRLPMAITTVFLLLIPLNAEQLFHFKISLSVYLLTLFYAVGPMIGQCYNLYYRLCWWDKMLHALGGVMFALVGLYLFQRFADNDGKKVVMAAVFALCFSIAVSVLWEFFEFGADTCLGMDMQQDTIISGFHSYLLGDDLGVTGSLENITDVVVNGSPLPGYIDVGLHDTMMDMLWETLGAVAVFAIHLCSKGKYSAFKASS